MLVVSLSGIRKLVFELLNVQFGQNWPVVDQNMTFQLQIFVLSLKAKHRNLMSYLPGMFFQSDDLCDKLKF